VTELLVLFALGSLTALACGLGTIPVFALGRRVEGLRPLLWGLAAGLMTFASVVGLLLPALDEGSPVAVGGGLAAGIAYASDRAGLGVFVILAIALQNIPEGTSVAIPMREAGFTAAQQFWAAVATSAPQPVGAVIAFALVELVDGLLPASFAFARNA